MHKVVTGILAAALLSAPLAARADWLFEGSAGQGWEVKPEKARQAANLMLTAGWQFAGIVSAELGAVATLANVKESKFDVQLRPMVELTLPLLPVYAKGIFAVTGLVDTPVKASVGAALGTRFGLMGVSIFLEAGAIPLKVEATTPTGKVTETRWIAEGRLGLRLG